MDVWELTQHGYHPEKAEENGNRFFTGNGFVGIRGTLDESRKDALVAWNLAGVYDRHGDNAWRESVNAPNGFFAELIGAGAVLRHAQRLDLRRALQSRESEYENATLNIERFACQHAPNLLCQRITVRCHLLPLTVAETQQYIAYRLGRAGWQGGELFQAAALPVIHTYARGIPRLINAVCDVALLAGYAAGSRQIDAAGIRKAIEHLEGTP